MGFLSNRARVAAVLAFGSGAAALAHQLIWTRRMVDVLGANADTFANVIGAFFLGLALGAWAAARWQPARAWRAVALAELAVGVLAAGVLLSAHGAPSCSLKFLLQVGLISPPAFAMGLVLPWLFAALRTPNTVGLYAINTLGGVTGVVVTLLWALPAWGTVGAGAAAIGLNLLVAAGAWLLQDQANAPVAVRAPAPVDSRLRWQAFGSGFLVLGIEVVMQRQFLQISINSLFSSGAVLALVLLSLAGAAWLVSAARDRLSVRGVLLAAAFLCAWQPCVLLWLRPGLTILPYELTPLPYVGQLAGIGLLALCPVLLVSGLLFPLLLKAVDPRSVGVLLAWNGLGGWLGAHCTEAWISPQFGIWTSLLVFACGYVLLLWTVPNVRVGFGLVAVAVSLALGAFITPRLPQVSVPRSERLASVAVGREGVVATVTAAPDDWRMLFNNSYTLGGSRAQGNQERQALLPLVLHGQPRRVACLGVATGSTVGGATVFPGIEQIDAIELSPLVLCDAERFFAPFNRDVFRDQRVRFIQEDARWVIAAQAAAYDVVVGDLFLPWRTGEGRLFTREHFQAVQRSLRPGGLYCQWLPMFQLTRPQFEAIARTFRHVFPEAYLIRGDFYADLPILGLVGGPAPDWAATTAACARIRAQSSVTDPLVRHVEGVAMTYIGQLPALPAGPVNTLNNGWLEWNAGHNILGMAQPWFIGTALAQFIQETHRAAQRTMPAELVAAHDAGQYCLTLSIASRVNAPGLPELTAQWSSRLPAALQRDPVADWTCWPVTAKHR
ncbi:MAG: Polyamine aminopropyltransferase [Verrucomicrobiae bacterium]|nr:Polyamine aminopropyltransferase [Verrucomicrobiae bacterium]